MTRRPTGKRRGRPPIAKSTVLPIEAPVDAKPLNIQPLKWMAGLKQEPVEAYPVVVLNVDANAKLDELVVTVRGLQNTAALQSEVVAMRGEVAALRLHAVPEGVNQLARTIKELDTSVVALRDGVSGLSRQINAQALQFDGLKASYADMLSLLGTHTDGLAASMIGDIHRIMQEWSRTLFPHLANETNKRITSLQAEVEQLRLALDKKAKRKARKAERDDAKAKRRVADLFGPSVRAAEARVGELDKARREAKRYGG